VPALSERRQKQLIKKHTGYETGSIVKSFELTDVPVRAGKFIARKNWIVCGSDDFQVRVLNYNTSEKVTSFEAVRLGFFVRVWHGVRG
jgi:hypothetical protein